MLKSIELKQQAEVLLQQAELARKEEASIAIAEIKEKMALFNLSLQDLRAAGIDPGRAPNKLPESRTPFKYRGPNGELWAGGRGQKPAWAMKVITTHGLAGLETFRINT